MQLLHIWQVYLSIDNSHYRPIFILAKKYIAGKSILQLVKLQSLVAKCCKMQFALQSSQILYTFVLRAEIATTFAPETVAISARNTKIYKICKLCKAFFSSHFTTFCNQTLQFY